MSKVLTCVSWSSQHVSSLDGHEWIVEFHDREEAGTFETKTYFRGKAVDINLQGPSRNIFATFAASVARFDLIVQGANETNFLDDLLNGYEKQMYAKVFRSGIEVFRGYFIRNQIIIKDEPLPYDVQLTLMDSINLLDEYDYKDTDDTGLSGIVTFKDHILQVLASCFADQIFQAGEEILVTSVPYWETSMETTAKDPLDMARVDHLAFTEYETRNYVEFDVLDLPDPLNDVLIPIPKEEITVSDYSTCAEVINRLCRLFYARFYFARGKYHFVSYFQYTKGLYNVFVYQKGVALPTVTSHDHNLAVNKAIPLPVNDKQAGGTFTFDQPLKRVVINHDVGVAVNVIQGLTWDWQNNDTITGIINIDNTGDPTLSISIGGEVLTYEDDVDPPDNPYRILHRYILGVRIKVGNFYLNRQWQNTFDIDGNPEYGELAWSADPNARVEIVTKYVVAGIEERIVEQFITPVLLGPGLLDMTVFVQDILLADGASLPTGGSFQVETSPGEFDFFQYIWTWSSYNNSMRINSDNEEENLQSRTFIRYTGEIDQQNTGKPDFDVKLGDIAGAANYNKIQIWTGSAWQDSAVWQVDGAGDALPILEHVVNHMAAMRTGIRWVMLGQLISKDEMIYPDSRIAYRGVTFLTMNGTYNSEKERINGQFYQLASDDTPVTTRVSGKITKHKTLPTAGDITANPASSNVTTANPPPASSQTKDVFEDFEGSDIVGGFWRTTNQPFLDPALYTDTQINARQEIHRGGILMRHRAAGLRNTNEYRVKASDIYEIELIENKADEYFLIKRKNQG